VGIENVVVSNNAINRDVRNSFIESLSLINRDWLGLASILKSNNLIVSRNTREKYASGEMCVGSVVGAIDLAQCWSMLSIHYFDKLYRIKVSGGSLACIDKAHRDDQRLASRHISYLAEARKMLWPPRVLRVSGPAVLKLDPSALIALERMELPFVYSSVDGSNRYCQHREDGHYYLKARQSPKPFLALLALISFMAIAVGVFRFFSANTGTQVCFGLLMSVLGFLFLVHFIYRLAMIM
jgi:hypothetical protein